MQRTRKQHFVPQFYLRQFAMNRTECIEDKDKGRIWVYDKATLHSHPAGILDIAQESYFYDLPPECFPAEHFPTVDTQMIEHQLAGIEGWLAKWVGDFLAQAETEPIGDEQMLVLSYFLALQLARTKEARAFMEEAGMRSVLDVSQEFLDRQFPDRNLRAKAIYPDHYWAVQQAKLMFSAQYLNAAMSIFLDHIWVIGVNTTGQPLYTSDHPVVRKANLRDPLKGGGNGIGSLGIEIAFPLSPRIILRLYDRTAFYRITGRHRTIDSLGDENVKYYNSMQVVQSQRHVFCSTDRFSLAARVCQGNPRVCQPDRQRIERIR